MTAPRCHRCGDVYELRRADDIHCERCLKEVAALIAADSIRRAPRFSVAKELAR